MSLRGAQPNDAAVSLPNRRRRSLLTDRNLLTGLRFDKLSAALRAMTWYGQNRQRQDSYQRNPRCLELALKQMIYFFADGVQVVETQVHDGIPDVSNLIEILQGADRQITDHARGHFGLAHLL